MSGKDNQYKIHYEKCLKYCYKNKLEGDDIYTPNPNYKVERPRDKRDERIRERMENERKFIPDWGN